MTILFNADEIFEMAEQIERNGARFYRRAAAADTGAAHRGLLLQLAAMEDQHEGTFADMRAEMRRQKQAPPTFDPQGEAVEYLREFVAGRIFDVKDDPSKRLTGSEAADEILKKAIGLEKDSIVFYLGIKDMVPERLGRDRVQGVIKEEMRHVMTLSRALAALKQ